MKWKAILGAMLILSVCTVASAEMIVEQGSLTTPEASGIVAFDGWTADNGGFMISWVVTKTDDVTSQGNDIYEYVYVLSKASGAPLTKLPSHLILEISSGFTADRMFTYNGQSITLGTWNNLADDGNSNPYMPDVDPDLTAIKLNPYETSTSKLTYIFTTDAMPVLGNFYSKDGRDAGVVAAAWNTGVTQEYGAKIIVPDTTTTTNAIPAPSALLLGVLGMGLVGLVRRLRR